MDYDEKLTKFLAITSNRMISSAINKKITSHKKRKNKEKKQRNCPLGRGMIFY